MQKLFSIVSKLQIHYYFKLDYQKCTNMEEACG